MCESATWPPSDFLRQLEEKTPTHSPRFSKSIIKIILFESGEYKAEVAMVDRMFELRVHPLLRRGERKTIQDLSDWGGLPNKEQKDERCDATKLIVAMQPG